MIEIITNQILIATVVSTVLAQIIKTILDVFRLKKFERQSLFRGAGMPSSHTATVVALALSVYLVEGASTIFIVTLVFASIVIRDVIGDKIFATHQENILNKIIKDIVKTKKLKRNHLIGHSIIEVFFGIIVGIVGVTLVFGF
ncbi:divergent PAP2 family protein [Candidatus Absconditicoccus praedator]|uniref:divergent PAP2 family protein n=1 Tax=Candidatus Absconditicoccus praedator TaxID=2735562 RepID=UPI001E4B331C|nr:divergent PAP2 family protein [Candidatus Absconditicoccus praedator]UFX83421.1 divergent PAP2 family protein [Candidatus Absconditicoccus praedator]